MSSHPPVKGALEACIYSIAIMAQEKLARVLCGLLWLDTPVKQIISRIATLSSFITNVCPLR